MACSCKRAKKFEQKYGVKQEESLLMKGNRYFFKALFFIIALGMGVIVIPYILVYSLYAIFFGDNKITLPKFMRKYLE